MTTSKQAKLRRTSSSRTRTASWFTGGDRFCGRDAGKCKPGRDDPESHAQIRLGVKNCTRSAVDCGLPDLYIEMPPTRVGHDMDGLMGNILSEDATPDYRKAELLAKRAEIQEA
jgi:hypothetical protein